MGNLFIKVSESLKASRVSRLAAAFALVLFLSVASQNALAQTATVSDVAANVVFSTHSFPYLLSALVYLIGLALGIYGIVRIKGHVDNPGNVPLRSGVIRLVIGGAFLAMPSVYTAMMDSIDGGGGFFLISLQDFFGFQRAGVADGGTDNVNTVLGNIVDSSTLLPALLSAASYFMGLVFGIIALLKTKSHVEDPSQTPLKEGVIYFLVGGALLTLPFIYDITVRTISGGMMFGLAEGIFGISNSSIEGGASCDPSGGTLGAIMCTVIGNTSLFPLFLDAMSYAFGLVMGFWGLIKIRDHVINPSNTPITQGITRLLAGGMFFALPYIVSVARNTVLGGGISNASVSGFSGSVSCGGGSSLSGLDEYLYCAVTDVLGPVQNIVNYAAMIAGIIFMMIGISRLLKSEQDGPRGPGGIGTVMTFITGGVLLSFNQFMTVLTGTLFSTGSTATSAALQYTDGLTADELAHAHMVVSAILKFMLIVGLISFARGIFIIRGVAEGNSQASVMAGVTHIIGGALAFNLGPLLNAVQETLGVTAFGITFS